MTYWNRAPTTSSEASMAKASGTKSARSRKAATDNKAQKQRLYTLEVFLFSGPVTAKFAKKNRVVSRTIQIRGDQALDDLHYAIFDAFDRWDQHMYEFQFDK